MASTTALTPNVTVTPPITTNGKGATFAANYHKVASLTPKQAKVIEVLGLIYGVSGVYDYTAKHAQLRTDSALFCQGLSMINMDVARAVTNWAGGYNTNSSITTDIAAMIKEGKDLAAMPDSALDKMLILMRYLALS